MSAPVMLGEAYVVLADSTIRSPIVFVERADSCWVPDSPPGVVALTRCVERFRFATRSGDVYLVTIGKPPRKVGSLWGLRR